MLPNLNYGSISPARYAQLLKDHLKCKKYPENCLSQIVSSQSTLPLSVVSVWPEEPLSSSSSSDDRLMDLTQQMMSASMTFLNALKHLSHYVRNNIPLSSAEESEGSTRSLVDTTIQNRYVHANRLNRHVADILMTVVKEILKEDSSETNDQE